MNEVTTKFSKEHVKQMVAWGLVLVMCFSLVKIGSIAVEGSTILGVNNQYCVTSGDGTTRGDGKLAHHYNSAPVFNWAPDGKTCTATFTCDFKDGETTVDCNVTSKLKTEPTCTANGVTEYVATVTMAKKDYVDTKDVADIPMAHKFTTTIKKATPKADGAVITTCSVCGYTMQDPILMPKKLVLSNTSYTYNGKAKTPKVTVKDYLGKAIDAANYSVKYTDNKKVGTATATVTFKGEQYSGTMTKTFKIAPVATKLSKAKSTQAKTLVVTWKKQTTQVSGYQIRYATNSSMKSAKTVTVKGADESKTTITNLKTGKTYYVQVRTYKLVDDKKVCSAWSEAKNVKIK